MAFAPQIIFTTRKLSPRVIPKFTDFILYGLIICFGNCRNFISTSTKNIYYPISFYGSNRKLRYDCLVQQITRDCDTLFSLGSDFRIISRVWSFMHLTARNFLRNIFSYENKIFICILKSWSRTSKVSDIIHTKMVYTRNSIPYFASVSRSFIASVHCITRVKYFLIKERTQDEYIVPCLREGKTGFLYLTW